jgi:hypothetical protein
MTRHTVSDRTHHCCYRLFEYMYAHQTQGITNIMGLDGVGDITSHHIVTASHDGSLAVWGSSGGYTSTAVTGAGVTNTTTAAVATAAAAVFSKSSVKALVQTVQAHERGVKVCS